MKIICIGRNYAAHAKELGNEVPDSPVIFCKPDTALLKNEEHFYYPDFSNEIQHELELVIRIQKMGKKIQKQFAHLYYNEISVGLDFTARDKQNELKQKGLPWELAKAFDGSACIGKFIPFQNHANGIEFSLKKNGELVQTGNSNLMIHSFDEIISFVSQYFTLKVGDLIYTGTPAGVGKIDIDDKLEAWIGDEKLLHCEIK
jgi:2-keto-4-pentenoate hydratase/2-oxohepta-3-ene-1,7-dioic acid hydratase in catechol pathway